MFDGMADLGTLFGGWQNTAGVVILLLVGSFLYRFRRDDGGPPRLGETIPFLSNTIAVVRNPLAFWDHVL